MAHILCYLPRFCFHTHSCRNWDSRPSVRINPRHYTLTTCHEVTILTHSFSSGHQLAFLSFPYLKTGPRRGDGQVCQSLHGSHQHIDSRARVAARTRNCRTGNAFWSPFWAGELACIKKKNRDALHQDSFLRCCFSTASLCVPQVTAGVLRGRCFQTTLYVVSRALCYTVCSRSACFPLHVHR